MFQMEKASFPPPVAVLQPTSVESLPHLLRQGSRRWDFEGSVHKTAITVERKHTSPADVPNAGNRISAFDV